MGHGDDWSEGPKGATATVNGHGSAEGFKYKCDAPGCTYGTNHAPGLARHKQGQSGIGLHPIFTPKPKPEGYVAPRKRGQPPPERTPLIRLPATGRVKEIQTFVNAALGELFELVEGMAVEHRALRDERDELRGRVDKIESALLVFRGERTVKVP